MIFLFFGSSLAHLEPKLQLFEVWKIMVRQIIIIIISTDPYDDNMMIDDRIQKSTLKTRLCEIKEKMKISKLLSLSFEYYSSDHWIEYV